MLPPSLGNKPPRKLGKGSVDHDLWWALLIGCDICFFIVLIFAVLIRSSLDNRPGIPVVPSGQFFGWCGYVVTWSVYVIASHRKQGFYTYFPYSVIIVFAFTIWLLLAT